MVSDGEVVPGGERGRHKRLRARRDNAVAPAPIVDAKTAAAVGAGAGAGAGAGMAGALSDEDEIDSVVSALRAGAPESLIDSIRQELDWLGETGRTVSLSPR